MHFNIHTSQLTLEPDPLHPCVLIFLTELWSCYLELPHWSISHPIKNQNWGEARKQTGRGDTWISISPQGYLFSILLICFCEEQQLAEVQLVLDQGM